LRSASDDDHTQLMSKYVHAALGLRRRERMPRNSLKQAFFFSTSERYITIALNCAD
jgi:hypothetical protein